MRDSEALDEVMAADGRSFRVEPLDRTPGVAMPEEFEPRRLARRTLQIVAVLVVVGLVLLLAPGLGEVRDLLSEARPEWVALAVAFEAVVRFLRLSVPAHLLPEHAVAHQLGNRLGGARRRSIVPASGAGGLALGAGIPA
jgi:hypothetical protein